MKEESVETQFDVACNLLDGIGVKQDTAKAIEERKKHKTPSIFRDERVLEGETRGKNKNESTDGTNGSCRIWS